MSSERDRTTASSPTPRAPSRRAWGPTRLARGSVPPRQAGADWITVALRARFARFAMAIGETTFAAILGELLAREPEVASLDVAEARLPRYLASRPSAPVWYAELAALDRAHAQVLRGPTVTRLTRRALGLERELTLIPAHALLELTTTVDELWTALEDAASTGVRVSARLPRSLDWPRCVLVWRRADGTVGERAVDADEAAALRAAARGSSLVELAAGMRGANPHARALDIICRWIDDGVLAA